MLAYNVMFVAPLPYWCRSDFIFRRDITSQINSATSIQRRETNLSRDRSPKLSVALTMSQSLGRMKGMGILHLKGNDKNGSRAKRSTLNSRVILAKITMCALVRYTLRQMDG